MARRVGVLLASAVLAICTWLILPPQVQATGETDCVPTTSNGQAGVITYSGSYIVGSRATIEGQALPLCRFTGTSMPSGSFQWAAIGNVNPNWYIIGANIVQVGYGRCDETNNNLGLGKLCTGDYWYYWAWGTEGCGSPDGSGPGYGPVPIRIGPSLSVPPANADFYVLRHSVNGVEYYDGYVNGHLLTGSDALGHTVSARVAASRLCWDADQTYRRLTPFGETFNDGDSMGGWVGSTKNHLDYNPIKYSVGSGWILTQFGSPQACNIETLPTYSCYIPTSSHTYIDTNR